MLHILWMLLKLILILLGIILGLVLLVILLVLFCPVRYYASAVKDCDDFKQIKARVSISWLFHGVWVRLFFENGALRHDIRLLGFSISGLINSMILYTNLIILRISVNKKKVLNFLS